MSDLDAALGATWPAASERSLGNVTLREGAGGGRRVSAATVAGAPDPALIDEAEACMRTEGGVPLFRVGRDQQALDRLLAARGYAVVDPTLYLAAPAARLARRPGPVSLLPAWPPLAIQAQIWAEAGTGPARIAVMARVQGPKAAFIARVDNRAAGVGFCALHEGTAMLHALEVLPAARRRGVGRMMVAGIAHWALEQGAATFALAVTEANALARALYESLGMEEAGGYHYREGGPR